MDISGVESSLFSVEKSSLSVNKSLDSCLEYLGCWLYLCASCGRFVLVLGIRTSYVLKFFA
jgi:hypothetical protein